MTTRSGRSYKGNTEMASEENAGVSELVKMLLEDRRLREEESARKDEALAEERSRREAEHQRRVEQMQEQMQTMREWMERSQAREGERAPRGEDRDHLKLTKLTESEDIEAFLTTFERMMRVYEVREDRWAFKLAPQLTGRAQQAYAALNADDSAKYKEVKAAILRRYDINEETYRQRFRTARRKEGEAYVELAIRLEDLLKKWMAECETVEAVAQKVAIEQLLNTMPADLRIWVGERKPKTSSEAGRLADDYLQARRRESGLPTKSTGQPWETRRKERSGGETRKCHACGQEGHLARNCPKKGTEPPPPRGSDGEKERTERNPLRCYNCGKRGHIAMHCPNNALFCDGGVGPAATRKGKVEGAEAEDILLDTGCSRTMVRRELVPEGKFLEGEAVTVRCAHGDMVLYPLAEVELELEGRKRTVKAAVSETLPVSVLLGTDVPELGQLLRVNPSSVHSEGVEEALVVTTRAQQKRKESEERIQASKEERSGVKPTPLETLEKTGAVERGRDEPEQTELTGEGEKETTVQDPEMPGSSFSEDLFVGGKTDRPRVTRRQKRQERHRHGLERAKDRPQRKSDSNQSLGISGAELRRLQGADHTLATLRAAAQGKVNAAGPNFFERDGLVYRRWVPPGREEETAIEQIVLPKECRRTVLRMAHTIPIAGHLGRKKTAQRILRRFYWPTLYKDVADFCRSCEACQKSTHRRVPKAPMIPLPVVAEPFQRLAMDIVGPLPRSRAGNRYVLVVCDYATRYPEAVALRNIDAESVAEELVKLFARVGIPREILTDQGTNFTSQLLAEVYRLLHVDSLRASPYHPQTDGLVERFNQTLKEMLRKTASEEGKDWDKLLPYVLFAYREVPQESTGFSPFELVYGREVRGPLDVLKETWESSQESREDVLSYVMLMRERLEKMASLVQMNVSRAQSRQKRWYDRTARQRLFQPGEQVLVLLPTSTSKLTAQWQGPYQIVKAMGRVNYQVDMRDRRKRHRVFHVNMLRKWHVPTSTAYLSQESMEESGDDVPMWDDDRDGVPTMGEQLTGTQRKELENLLGEFSKVLQAYPGCTNLTEHSIDTGEAAPVRLPPYRLPHAYCDQVQQELKDMLEHGIIEPSQSDWAAPIVLVNKKDGSLRLCVDYWRLNTVSRADAYPMPRVDDLIDQLGSAQYITTLDLTRGYWQVPVAQESQHKTAFATPFGFYQFKRMPFGLQGAPATFQRMMDKLLSGYGHFANAYLDDLVIYSASWPEHLQHVRAVFKKLQEAGLTAKPKKCQFGMSQCVYLGHIVGGGRVQVESSKVKAVREFGVPRTKKDVRSFLGMTGYYRKFIPQYSSIASPLTDLTRKTMPTQVEWTPDCAAAFEKLKTLLCSSPVLRTPDFEKDFLVQTDASERGIGAVLSQLDENGADHPVAYFSRKLLPREEKYATVEKECLAVKLGIQAFRVYLLGKPFTVQTDHRALHWLDRMKEHNPRLTRWSLSLQPYQFEMAYRPGSQNGNADGLSRRP